MVSTRWFVVSAGVCVGFRVVYLSGGCFCCEHAGGPWKTFSVLSFPYICQRGWPCAAST